MSWARIFKNTLKKQLFSLTYFFIFACLNMYQNIYSFIAYKLEKNWPKWAKWARTLKNTLPDEQLCSKTCFLVFACPYWLLSLLTCSLVFACLNQNINLFILFKIREKEQAKWAKWARILKNALTDEQLCSLTCFFYLLA